MQTALHLLQGLGEEPALHQAPNVTEIHHRGLHRTTAREKRDRQEIIEDGEQQGQRGSVTHTGLKPCCKAHSEQEAENKDTGVSLIAMPITKPPIKAPCLKSGDLGYNASSTKKKKGSD